ncbi:unnamed protein product [Rhizoctonia solani]|uniref:Uncharacterized protein n=1 Tax=Rhizoctonia solani TaxID=456999 RepID=A0A8H3B4P4_9AGAM|nr:unnamed protein product [Rhizoctonia solani]
MDSQKTPTKRSMDGIPMNTNVYTNHGNSSQFEVADLSAQLSNLAIEEGIHPSIEGELGTEDKDNRDTSGNASHRTGPTDYARQWAYLHYEDPIAGLLPDGRPAWIFKCKHCPKSRRVPRTPGMTVFDKKLPILSSNLTSHLNKPCPGLPPSESYEAYMERVKQAEKPEVQIQEAGQQSLGAMFAAEDPAPLPPPNSLSKTVFRSTLIQGVVRDTFALTFGEGEGMKIVFALVNPLVKLPSHQTMARDLLKLYAVLSDRFCHVMKVQNSRISITSDAWSSKNSIYSIAGVFVTFIDQHWNLQELVTDVIHLNAEHSGAMMGQKIFQSLRHRNAASNLIASAIGIDDAETDEAYQSAKAFGYEGRIEESAEILTEEARLQGLASELDSAVDRLDDGSDLSDLDPDFDGDSDTELVNDKELGGISKKAAPRQGHRTGKAKAIAELSPIQKIHSVVVHSTASALRRRKMGEYIKEHCPVPRAVIKGMPAFEQWVNNLDVGKTGRARKVAQALKLKWMMADDEWAVAEELVRILEPFDDATHSFSKSGKVHICNVLPTYIQLQAELQSSRVRLVKQHGPNNDPYGLINAISQGETKLNKYLELARNSRLIIIASALHPGMRLTYFQDESIWGGLMQRARNLIEELFEKYKTEADIESNKGPDHLETPANHNRSRPKLSRTWSDKLNDAQRSTFGGPASDALDDELTRFFGNIYKYKPGTSVLKWWKVMYS